MALQPTSPGALTRALANVAGPTPLPPARVESPSGAFGSETGVFSNMLGVLVALTLALWAATLLSGANLMLTDALDRVNEGRIRSALGATHADAWARVLAETSLLALLAAVVSGAFAMGMNRVAPWFLPFFGSDTPFDIALGRAGFLTTAVLAGATAVLSAIPAAVAAVRISRSAAVRRGPSRGDASAWGLVGQLAIATTLMSVTVGLTLQIRAFDGEWVGFENAGVSVDFLSLPEGESSERIASLLSGAGDARYAVTERLPVYGARFDSIAAGERAAAAAIEAVTPDFFEVVGAPLRQGTPARARGEAVISEDLAEELRLGAPVGTRLTLTGGEMVRVVGVVGAATWGSGDVRPTVYRGWEAEGVRSAVLLGRRTDGSTPEVGTRLERFAGSGIGLRPFDTLRGLLVRSRVLQEFRSRLAAFIGLLGLVVSVGGTYAHFLRWVRARETDTAIRAALGAQALNLGGGLIKSAMRLIGPGVIVGIAVGAVSMRVMFSSLGESGASGLALPVAGIVVASSSIAALVPSFRRTQRTSPLALLRGRP